MLCVSLTSGCTKSEPKELIRIADFTERETKIKEITNEKNISQMNWVIEKVIWKEDIFRPKGKKEYSFWLEEVGGKERITNYDVWFEDRQTIIFDKTNGKYGVIDNNRGALIIKQMLTK